MKKYEGSNALSGWQIYIQIWRVFFYHLYVTQKVEQ